MKKNLHLMNVNQNGNQHIIKGHMVVSPGQHELRSALIDSFVGADSVHDHQSCSSPYENDAFGGILHPSTINGESSCENSYVAITELFSSQKMAFSNKSTESDDNFENLLNYPNSKDDSYDASVEEVTVSTVCQDRGHMLGVYHFSYHFLNTGSFGAQLLC